MESFIHKISKGSSFNQIYIPREMDGFFEAGDLVKISLIRKKISFYSSKNLSLSSFKEKLIRELFSSLSKFKEIKQLFVIGSFLTQRDYNDIDILAISEKNIEKEIYGFLNDKFELKFHIIIISEKNFKYLQESCPLTRSMLYFYISNKGFNLPKSSVLDKSHIKFLLMMPQDLLELKLPSRVFFDNLRRLLAIERYLKNKEINPLIVNKELEALLKEPLFSFLKNNEEINGKILKKLRFIIKAKLNKINSMLK